MGLLHDLRAEHDDEADYLLRMVDMLASFESIKTKLSTCGKVTVTGFIPFVGTFTSREAASRDDALHFLLLDYEAKIGRKG